MPQINLLVTVAGKKKKAKSLESPQIEIAKVAPFFIPISIVMSVVLIICWLILSFFTIKDKKELAALENKKGNLTASVQEIKETSSKREMLSKKVELLDNLSSRKVFWSEKLKNIADAVPQGVWLTEISLDKLNIFPKEKKEEGNGQADKFMLTIKGRAYAYKIQDAVTYIGKFNNLLKEDESFFKDFTSVELSSVAKSSVGKTDIMNFEFSLNLR